MPREEFSQIFTVNVSVSVAIKCFKRLLHHYVDAVVAADLLNQHLVAQMESPHITILVHRARAELYVRVRATVDLGGLFGQKRSMEVVNWQEGLTELAVSEKAISIFIKSLQERCQFRLRRIDGQLLQALAYVSLTD